jgi:hypothetical protein
MCFKFFIFGFKPSFELWKGRRGRMRKIHKEEESLLGPKTWTQLAFHSMALGQQNTFIYGLKWHKKSH